VQTIDWSSSHDILLIGCYDSLTAPRSFVYLIYDAARQEVIFTIDAASLGLSGSIADISKAAWTPDGQYLIVYHANTVNSDETAYWMRIYGLDGTLLRQEAFYIPNRVFPMLYPTTGSRILYLATDRRTLIIFDPADFTTLAIPAPVDEFGWVDWSPDGDYAFVYGGKIADYIDDAENINPVWLLSIPDQSLTLLSARSRPLNLKRQRPRFYQMTTWSPSGESGYIVDAMNRLLLVKPSTGEIVILYEGLNPEAELYPQFVRWHNQARSLTLVEYPTYPGTFYDYDVRTGDLLSTFEAAVTFNNFAYSPSEQYLAYSSSDCAGICLVDTGTGEETGIEFSYSPDQTGSAMELLWHPEQDWLIAAGLIDPATHRLRVSNVDGSINRTLADCFLEPACIGWLPDREKRVATASN
jgi:WD40 repeat protein